MAMKYVVFYLKEDMHWNGFHARFNTLNSAKIKCMRHFLKYKYKRYDIHIGDTTQTIFSENNLVVQIINE